MELTCPKCQGTMRSYERSGVTVDACNDCRGIFLDHGELRRLMDAETSYYTPEPRSAAAPVAGPGPAYGSPAPGSAPPESYRARPYRDDEDRDRDRDRDRDEKDRYREVKDRYRDEKDRYRDDKDKYRDGDRYRDDRGGWGRSDQYDPRRKKKRSFLEELFD